MLLALVAAFTTSSASAGERIFAFSYGYGTVPKGGIEVENYNTAAIPEEGDVSWKHQAELEYGLTDRLEGGLYLVTENAGGGPIAFSGWKARLKYRFGAEGVGAVDPALYFEYIGSPNFDEHALEVKFILGKDINRFRSALNVEYKFEFGGDELVHEIAPSLGLGFKVAKPLVLGLEVVSELEFVGEEVEGPRAWAGPTVHLAGEGGKLWWTLSALAPVAGDAAEDKGWMVRSLVAVNL